MISYSYLVNHIVPGPQSVSYFIPIVLVPLALAVPPEKLSQKTIWFTFLPAIVGFSAHAWWAMGGVDVLSADLVLWAIFIFGVKDARRDFRRLIKRLPGHKHYPESTRSREGKRDLPDSSIPKQDDLEYDEVPYPSGLLDRVSWIGALMASLRLTDWKVGDPSHDRRQPTRPSGKGHLHFIAVALLRSVLGYISLDITASYILIDPYFHNLDVSITSSLPVLDVSNTQLQLLYTIVPPLLLRVAVIATQAYATIAQQYHLPLIILVSAHYFNLIPDAWSPHLWPTYFGPVTSILDNGLAGFWGTYWHQVMRWVVSGTGPAIADALGFKRESQTQSPSTPNNSSIFDGTAKSSERATNGHANGTTKESCQKTTKSPQHNPKAARTKLIRYAILTLVAFFNSGVVHMGLVPPQPLHATSSANKLRLLVGSFFWLQPFGIAFEQAIASLIVRSGVVDKEFRTSEMGQVVRRTVNFLWICVWSCACFPLLGEVARQLGWFRYYLVPFSLLRWALGQEAVMWPCLR